MSKLTCRDIHKSFGDVEVLKGVDVDAQNGEFVVLLGSSGCGKSTLLRIIAGLEKHDGGQIIIDEDDISNMHPRNRNIAMVFQNYALYPLMSVEENLSFGMRINKVPSSEIKGKVKQIAETLGILELLERKPGQLSGGQRQRVAIGRAMVRDPRLFLFDEPLSNLDAKLRARMRGEIKILHQQIGATTVYVTHDQLEALSMADRLLVMRTGRIEQVGTPEEVFNTPQNVYVASFLGSPEINLLDAEISSGSCSSQGVRLPLPHAAGSTTGKVVYAVRPHNISLCSESEPGAIAGKVALVETAGSFSILHLEFGTGNPLVMQLQGSRHPQQGEQCSVQVNAEHVHLFDPASEQAIVHGSLATSGG